MSSSSAALAASAAAGLLAGVVIARSKSGRTLLQTVDSDVEQRIKSLVEQTPAVIFSKSYCPFCKKTKATFAQLIAQGVLDRADLAIVELDETSDGADIQAALLKLTKQRTVPNVWVKGLHVGGNDDLQAAYASGALVSMLKK
jgi:glutaredoxin 3